MENIVISIFLWFLIAIPLTTIAKTNRSTSAKHEFQRINPCPHTGATRGGCKGMVIDHIIPLCAGGADAPSNMQWQTLVESKIKDNAERRQCQMLRRQKINHA